MSKKLPYLKSYRDRHDKVRHYLRQPGVPPIALPGDYGTREFIEAYWAARESAPKREIGAEKTVPGTFADLIVRYYKSDAYAKLKPITKATYRNVIEKLRAARGDMMVKGVRQRHVAAILDGLSANKDTWRKVLRLLLKHALACGWIDVHPMSEMRRPRKAAKGFRSWTEEEIAAFEAKWPLGSRERLALALLLYTGQRRADVVKMGRQHVENGTIRVVQQKTGTELWIAMHAALKAAIEAAPKAHLTFVTTQYGEPFSAAGFTSWFVGKAKEAGLSGCTPHGLRKAAARRLAEAGCTPHQIMAVTGHKNLAEVTLYTEAADQQRLAAEAVAKTEMGTKVSTPPSPVRQSGQNV